MKLKNRKGMDYCFPLWIIQFENGDLYYIDPFKSLFLVILFPIRIFFPVKLYKITDREEKKLAYGRYRDDRVEKNFVRIHLFGLSMGGILNSLFNDFRITHQNIERIMQCLYICITISIFVYMHVRRYRILKVLKLENYEYKYAKLKIDSSIIYNFFQVIIVFFLIYFVFAADLNGSVSILFTLVYIYNTSVHTIFIWYCIKIRVFKL